VTLPFVRLESAIIRCMASLSTTCKTSPTMVSQSSSSYSGSQNQFYVALFRIFCSDFCYVKNFRFSYFFQYSEISEWFRLRFHDNDFYCWDVGVRLAAWLSG